MTEKEIINADVKYEPKDASGKWLGAILVLIVITAIILLFLLWGFYGHFEASYGHGAVIPEAKNLERFNSPPEPNLKSDPIKNYREFRRAEDEKLNDYGWIDKEKGIVHIPIEQAMKQLADKGLPEIQPANNDADLLQNDSPTANSNMTNQQRSKKR